MLSRNVLSVGTAILVLAGGAQGAPTGSREAQEHPLTLLQIDADGMPATPEEQARRERTPHDMAPDTGYGERIAQSMGPASGRPMSRPPLPPPSARETKSVALSQVDRPDRTLIDAPVESKDGHKVGEVAQVTLDTNGKADEVVLNDDAGTRIASSSLVFEPDRGVLVARLPAAALAPLRGAPRSAPPHSAPPDTGVPERPPPDMPDTRPGHNGY